MAALVDARPCRPVHVSPASVANAGPDLAAGRPILVDAAAQGSLASPRQVNVEAYAPTPEGQVDEARHALSSRRRRPRPFRRRRRSDARIRLSAGVEVGRPTRISVEAVARSRDVRRVSVGLVSSPSSYDAKGTSGAEGLHVVSIHSPPIQTLLKRPPLAVTSRRWFS